MGYFQARSEEVEKSRKKAEAEAMVAYQQRATDELILMATEAWRNGSGDLTADDLVERLGGHPDSSHTPNSRNSSIGSVFIKAANAGMVEDTGRMARSKQPTRNRSKITVWAVAPDWTPPDWALAETQPRQRKRRLVRIGDTHGEGHG